MSGTIFDSTENQAGKPRKCGVLLPIFSLPDAYGIGTIGAVAREFIGYLASAGVKVWQILPLLPTSYGDSPYQSVCSYALNYYFIDLQLLKEEGLFTQSELNDYAAENAYTSENSRIDYEKLFRTRVPLLKKAFSRFERDEYLAAHRAEAQNFAAFLKKGEYYDFALFMSLKTHFSYRPWQEWGEYAQFGEEKAEKFAAEHAEEIRFWQFTQYEFLKQWSQLRKCAEDFGVELLGDMPIYVSGDSVEMWKYGKSLFETDENGRQTQKAGVPPDAFSADGQLWGNPVYRWDEMKKNGYRWWKERIRKALALFDAVRIDHFRGFDRYFSIPQNAQTAREGEWKDGPKEACLNLRSTAKRITPTSLRILRKTAWRIRARTIIRRSPLMSVRFPNRKSNGSCAISATNAKNSASIPRRLRPKIIVPMRYGSRLLLRRIFAWRRCTICWRSAKKPASTRRPRFQQKTGVSAIRKRGCYRRKSKKRFCALRLSIADKKNTRDKNRRRTFPFRSGVYAVRGGIFYAESKV